MINTSPTESEFGKKLKKLLIKERLTQRDLFWALRNAEFKVSESNVSNKLKGIIPFSDDEVKFLQNEFPDQLK